MINKIKPIFLRNKLLIKNFSYLSAFQIFNIFIPLATYPYLIRILGSETYGLIIFALSIVTYFSMIINFGFNISATKDVAENKNNNNKLNEIVSSVFIIKIFLWFVSFVFLLVLIAVIPSFRENWLLFFLVFGMTFNELLFPQWFFQGIEKMKYITIINIISKIVFASLIFIFIKQKEDYLLMPLFTSLGALVGGGLSIYVVFIRENIHFSFQKKTILKYYFTESLPLFISQASIRFYVNANRILVGTFLGMTEVAFYDLGEKILSLLKIPVGMLGQAAFPSLANQKSIPKINNVMKLGVLLTFILIFLVFIFSDLIVNILGGESMQGAVPIMRILSISALMVAFSQFLGISRLIIFGYKMEFTKIIASSGVIFLLGVLYLYFMNNITVISLAWLAVLVETWVTVVMLIVNYNKNLLK